MAECESELLAINAATDCPNVRNEINQLFCVIRFHADFEGEPDYESDLAQVRDRTLALLRGEKHPKRRDIDDI